MEESNRVEHFHNGSEPTCELKIRRPSGHAELGKIAFTYVDFERIPLFSRSALTLRAGSQNSALKLEQYSISLGAHFDKAWL
jgi:hypothetical protein